jgi:hypothetical protein
MNKDQQKEDDAEISTANIRHIQSGVTKEQVINKDEADLANVMQNQANKTSEGNFH